MKKYIIATGLLIFSFLLLLITGCRHTEIFDNENLMQIKRASLREGVFLRRYMMTKDYGTHQVITPQIIKNYINTHLEPDYLFVEDAYRLGYDTLPPVHQKIQDYRINLLAGNHPFNYEKLSISKKALQEYYHKKSNVYDIDIIQANSYSMADSVYKFLLSGKKFVRPKEEMVTTSYPKFYHLKEVTIGRSLHPDLYARLTELKEGQFSQPFFITPTWTVVILNTKDQNKKLKPFEEMESELLNEIQAFIKYDQQKELISSLKDKYQVHVEEDYLDVLFQAVKSPGSSCIIDAAQIEPSELIKRFISIKDETISRSDFIYSFNDAFGYMQAGKLAKQDLEMFMETFINQNLLYRDALDKGIDKDLLIQDQLQNKEHKILLAKYLKDEIEQKVTVTEQDARMYYGKHQDRWTGEFDHVVKSIMYELKSQRIKEYQAEVTGKLRKKYEVRYNDALLKKAARQLTEEKQKGSSTEK